MSAVAGALLTGTDLRCALRVGDLNGAYAYAEGSKNVERRQSLRFRSGSELVAPTLGQMRQVAADLDVAAIVEFMPDAHALLDQR